MDLDAELLRKHAAVVKDALAEARVKAYTRRSKTGKAVMVADFERRDRPKRKSYTSRGRLRNNPGSEFERPFPGKKLKKKKKESEWDRIHSGNRRGY